MLAGIDWTWETFPEYLATVDRLPKAINYGAYIGHSALRMYVMGKRALSEKATEDDLARMAAAVQEAIRAGAMGFSSSRSPTHVTPDDTPVASRIADWTEVDRLWRRMAELGAGIFQVGPDISGGAAQRAFLARLRQVALETGRPVMFGTHLEPPGRGPESVDLSARLSRRLRGRRRPDVGADAPRARSTRSSRSSPICRSTCCRPGGELRRLPLAEQKRRLPIPRCGAQLVADEAAMKPRDNVFQGGGAATTDPRKPDYDNLFAMKGVEWDDPTVASSPATRGQHPVEVMIDLSLANDNQVFVQPLVNE